MVEAARKQNVTLEHSCLRGRCSTCKVHVIAGESSPRVVEVAVNLLDLDKDYILSCVRVPESDMVLDAEDLGACPIPLKRTFSAEINSVINYNEDLVKIELRLPPTQKFIYLSGQ
ncbi:2Fe-2S iron-sulfur cluster-binding protein [Salinimicrobium oceani]|uniref:2Fe-2S iron-sulfur cluster binding domain-containing protein n=1 Tax=Salinimicrobium oceani TaxID=2722702 RepID=A0ABX1D066_9FLAO|nr:2Fe-2S iron-sulfur cluster-binding protein [Salinimicrobium oceani]NJW53452.1 2Fe-2S iron-sulfur cluster binding domain-containing protein [Salinimicrobium oceani]